METCVCCGKVIPEGHQVCYECETEVYNDLKKEKEIYDSTTGEVGGD